MSGAPEILAVDAALGARLAPLVPELVRATGPISYGYQFGERRAFFDAFVRGSWHTTGTLFAHDAARAALVDGELAGLEIGFDGPEFQTRRDALARVSAELLANGETTPDELRGLAVRSARASYLNPHVPRRVHYVHALSVPERLRGRGIGARLLEHAIERARRAGHRVLQLDVLADNPAVRFYESMGLSVLVETRSHELSREHGFPSELRMELAL